MKWTNHPRIFFEVAVVKLCQGPKAGASAAAQPEVDNLVNKVRQLEQEIERLKTQGVQVSSAPAQAKEASRPQKSIKSAYKAPVGRIHEILKDATRPDLEKLKGCWGQLLAQLKQQNTASGISDKSVDNAVFSLSI